ncbi:hypothetical protein HGA88_06845 [Candidatus Roizmanbacteria bacterium]|nr:hypothetical protein [Candidatus Roizmanbacteria bacterium]
MAPETPDIIRQTEYCVVQLPPWNYDHELRNESFEIGIKEEGARLQLVFEQLAKNREFMSRTPEQQMLAVVRYFGIREVSAGVHKKNTMFKLDSEQLFLSNRRKTGEVAIHNIEGYLERPLWVDNFVYHSTRRSFFSQMNILFPRMPEWYTQLDETRLSMNARTQVVMAVNLLETAVSNPQTRETMKNLRLKLNDSFNKQTYDICTPEEKIKLVGLLDGFASSVIETLSSPATEPIVFKQLAAIMALHNALQTTFGDSNVPVPV